MEMPLANKRTWHAAVFGRTFVSPLSHFLVKESLVRIQLFPEYVIQCPKINVMWAHWTLKRMPGSQEYFVEVLPSEVLPLYPNRKLG